MNQLPAESNNNPQNQNNNSQNNLTSTSGEDNLNPNLPPINETPTPLKKQKIAILAFLLLAAVLTTTVVYIAFLRKNGFEGFIPTPASPTISSTIAISPTPFIVEGTKNYKNQAFGFEFDYPANFQAIEQDNQTEFLINLRSLGATEKSGQSFLIIVQSNTQNIDIIEWFNDPKVRERGKVLLPSGTLKLSKTLFGGNAWYALGNNSALPEFPPNAKIIWAIDNKNKIILLATVNINADEYKDSIYQILSSFNFSDTVLPGEAANQEDCLEKGGVWQAWGELQQEFCQIAATDSGKTCNDGSVCSLESCITKEEKLPGNCREYKYTYGCFSEITKGKISPKICFD